jgi:hypothetical protein
MTVPVIQRTLETVKLAEKHRGLPRLAHSDGWGRGVPRWPDHVQPDGEAALRAWHLRISTSPTAVEIQPRRASRQRGQGESSGGEGLVLTGVIGNPLSWLEYGRACERQ